MRIPGQRDPKVNLSTRFHDHLFPQILTVRLNILSLAVFPRTEREPTT